MADVTFNPNGYNKTEIAAALANGLDMPNQLSPINTSITNLTTNVNALSGMCNSLDSSVASLETASSSHTSSISTINSKISTICDLIKQITFEGSVNKLQLDESNMTVSGSHITATFTNGSIHIVKSTGLFSDSDSISFTGLTIPAGTWYLGIPIPGLVAPWTATLKDSNDLDIISTGSEGVSESFTLPNAITNASLTIDFLYTYSTNGRDIVPYLATTVLSEEDAVPYFKSLAEVSVDESS